MKEVEEGNRYEPQVCLALEDTWWPFHYLKAKNPTANHNRSALRPK